MPELPEVETICRGLSQSIVGDTITSVEVLRIDSIGFPEPKTFGRRLVGSTVKAVTRRGKYILIDFNDGSGLVVHLRMSGRLLVVQSDTPPERFLRVRFALASGRDVRFEDMRVFGRVWYVPKGNKHEEIVPTLATLGPEPLEALNDALLAEKFSGKRQSIKSALTDQRIIAGIGNIYADEALFQAGIHPLREARSLKRDELVKLSKVIEKVLQKAIKNRGTTLKDYRDTEGLNGNYQNQSWVYGRTGKPCRVCTRPIERLKIAGRSSHFCLKCQPMRQRLKV